MTYSLLSAVVWAAIAFLVGVAIWTLRGRWDIIIAHGRDAGRHLLAGVLMLGTLAGTVWTFSNGQLTVSGVWESLVSVGGVAAALELGVIYCGLYLGELDTRITTARKAEARDQLAAKRKVVMRWFYGVAVISAVANLIFRTVQLHNFWLALLPAGAPVVLVVLFTVVLRPLPRDHQEIGRQAAQRGLVMLAQQAQAVMLRSLRRMGRGHMLTEAEMAQLTMALAFQRAYISGDQAQALDQIVSLQATSSPAPLQLAGPNSAAGGAWLTSADLQAQYAISERTAQTWMSQTPGRRQRPHTRTLEAPAAAIYAAHGVPAIQATSGPAPRRKRNRAPAVIDFAQFAAGDASVAAGDALLVTDHAPLGDLEMSAVAADQTGV